MIIPSIDLMEGEAVQLVQGRKDQKKIAIRDVFALAEKLSQFPVINVIDLDAAMGEGTNKPLILELAKRYKIRVGGGIRTPALALEYLQAGAQKIIIGSAAFTPTDINYPFLDTLKVDPSQVIIAIDSFKGNIVKSGWKESTQLQATTTVKSLEPYCSEFLFTQVEHEGRMQGFDLNQLLSLKNATMHQLSAAGGISTPEELATLQSLNIHAVLGMALYTGKLSLDVLQGLKGQHLSD
jgi:phosphoribosylformimino-5-aminoimidazole carboxamide ribotide isomerase